MDEECTGRVGVRGLIRFEREGGVQLGIGTYKMSSKTNTKPKRQALTCRMRAEAVKL